MNATAWRAAHATARSEGAVRDEHPHGDEEPRAVSFRRWVNRRWPSDKRPAADA